MRNRLPGLALAALVTVTAAGAMAQAEAERRLDAAIERLRASLPPELTLEIGGRTVDPVTGQATLRDVVLRDAQNRLTVPELRVADVTETRLGRAEALRGSFTSTTGGTGEVARVLVAGLPIPVQGKRLDISNLTFDALEVEAARMDDAAKGMLRLGRLQARGWTPQAIAGASLEAFEFRDAAANGPQAQIGRVALEAVSLPMANGEFAPLAFRANAIEVEGAALREPGQNVTLNLGSFVLRDWQPGSPTSLAVQALRVVAPASGTGLVDMTVAKLEAAGIDAARSVEAYLGGRQAPDPFPGRAQRILLEGLEASLDGQQVVALGRFLTEAALNNGIASGAMSAEGLRVVPPRGQADWLEAIGMREIAGGIELRGTMPRAGGRLEIAPFRIGWEQAVTLTLATQLDNMPATPEGGSVLDPQVTLAQLANGSLAGATLTIRDHGLLGRVLAMQARQQRVPEARLREQWAQMALAMPLPGAAPPAQPQRGRQPAPPAAKGQPAPQAGGDPLAAAREALASFIRQPGTLEITLRPARAVPFMDFAASAGQPGAMVQRLGLSVVAR
jgi:hypothetical protein